MHPPWCQVGAPELKCEGNQIDFFRLVRSEGLEPPRCYSLPPQGSASTNSATSAMVGRRKVEGRINGADVTNRPWGDKARLPFKNKDLRARDLPWFFHGYFRGLPRPRGFRQHLLDLDRDAVPVDPHDPAGDRQVVGQHLDLVGFGGVQLDDG